MVAGHATDADTDLPLPNAEVVVGWSELVVDRSTMATSTLQHAASVKTGARGEYRLCGVPTSTSLVVQLQHDALAKTAVRAVVDDLRRRIPHAPDTSCARSVRSCSVRTSIGRAGDRDSS